MFQSATGIINSALDNTNDNFDIGVAYEQGSSASSLYQTENRAIVNFATSISDKWMFSGSLGIPVGGGNGITQSAVGGDFELQYLFNEDGSLKGKIFNRQNTTQQLIGDVQGYTQGLGLSYQVDFNSFAELRKKLFARKQTPKKPVETDSILTEKAKDSLMRYKAKPKAKS